jgi:hypothetical protein
VSKAFISDLGEGTVAQNDNLFRLYHVLLSRSDDEDIFAPVRHWKCLVLR